MWGRNIYHNIGRFLQFQVTVNLSLLLTVAIGSPILAESPFSAVQLLWINLIMDTLACLALATEKPLASVLNGPPFKDDTNLLTPAIWRQILGVTFWNVSVMLIVILIGPSILGLDYVYTTSANDSDESGQNKLRHLTIIFNVFVFLQIYNLTNCRKIGRRDFNILEGIH
jgi:magnesium-transporting ATPase (P-type)